MTAHDVLTRATKCRRHQWASVLEADDEIGMVYRGRSECVRCHAIRDETRARRGKQSRNYGNRAELAVSRKYGGTKIGHAGGPVDVQGTDWDTQVRTHRRLPPAEWRKAFAAMPTDRMPRLLLRFLPGPGLPPIDYFVVPGQAWLDWHGKDE